MTAIPPSDDYDDPGKRSTANCCTCAANSPSHLDSAGVEIARAHRFLDRLTSPEVGDSELADSPAAGDIRALLTAAGRDLRAALATLRAVPE